MIAPIGVTRSIRVQPGGVGVSVEQLVHEGNERGDLLLPGGHRREWLATRRPDGHRRGDAIEGGGGGVLSAGRLTVSGGGHEWPEMVAPRSGTTTG